MILKLKPIFMDKIWGGRLLKELFHYETSDQCGECWGISAHPSASNGIDHPTFKDVTLRTLYKTHPELFGHYQAEEFPILVKLIHAQEDLSIQVPPDDLYAQRFKSYGKEECWTILNAQEEASLYMGHSFNTPEALLQSLNQGTFMSKIKKHPVQVGDFYYIPTGTLHAIGAGIVLLEVQQSSDLTFRLFDYHRLENGHPRTLHLEDALAVMHFPDQPVLRQPQNTFFDYQINTYHEPSSKTADRHGDYVFVMEGEGYLNETPVKKGDFLMVSSFHPYEIKGSLTLQTTQIVKKH